MPKTSQQDPSNNYGKTVPKLSDSLPRPDLAPVDWKRLGLDPPRPVDFEQSPWDKLPAAPVVVITWTTAEWAALDHVFCGWDEALSADESTWSGWQSKWVPYRRGFEAAGPVVYSGNPGAPSLRRAAWGSYRLVSLAPDLEPVLLIKSDMHVGTDGKRLPLRGLVERIIEECRPELILTVGTAGGAHVEHCMGTVVVSNSFELQLGKGYEVENGLYTSGYRPDTKQLEDVRDQLFLPTPVVMPELEDLAKQICVPVGHLMNSTIDPSEIERRVDLYLEGPESELTHELVPVYTSNSYDVGTTSGNLAMYSCLEMGDAFVAKVAADCDQTVQVGSVRSISDPVVNASLNAENQHTWSTQLYETYGLYTSLNGALATWSLIKGGRGGA